MKIYFASGFSLMNVPGRERDIYERFGLRHRLVSFFDTRLGNNIFQCIDLVKELDEEGNKCQKK